MSAGTPARATLSGRHPPRRQAGVALLAMITVVVLVSASLLIARLDEVAQARHVRDATTAEALFAAKEELIGWAVWNDAIPGALPLPDRNGDLPDGYDGDSDCVPVFTDLTPDHLIGRLPWRGQGGPCLGNPAGFERLLDASGEPLWYAVSQKLVRGGDSVTSQFIEPQADWSDPAAPPYSWLVVRDQTGVVISDRVAAVIIAPGPPVAMASLPPPGQQERPAGAHPGPEHFLDEITIGGTTYANWDNDGDFILHPDTTTDPDAAEPFNDRLVYVTVDELMPLVERRVLEELRSVLLDYKATYVHYPWLAPFADPSDVDSFRGALNQREGLVPFHSSAQSPFATRLRVVWDIDDADVDATIGAGILPVTVVTDGDIEIGVLNGECTWTDAATVDCEGRFSFGILFTREWQLDLQGLTGVATVTAPEDTTSGLRERAVAVAGALPDQSAIPIRAITVTDRLLGVPLAQSTLTLDDDTTGAITVSRIQYDLDVPGELPEWYLANGWHRLLYAAIGPAFLPGGGAPCCETLEDWPGGAGNKEAVVVSAGPPLAGQARPSGLLGNYLEDENATAGDDTFERGRITADFNDQARPVAP